MEKSEVAKRPLTWLDMVCLGLNAIIGSSIFLFPGRLAGMLGPASILSFGIVGLLLTSVALCFAEASSYYDRAGGSYLYAREAFGDLAGFGIGWMCWVTQILGWAAVANGVAVYLGFLGPAWTGAWLIKSVAACVIIAMGTLNYRGVKLGAWASNVFTVAKLIPLFVLIFAGLPKVSTESYIPFAPQGWSSLGSACFLTYFSFQGFESIPVPSGEVHRAQRNIPLAVISAMAFASLFYMMIQAVAVGVYPGLSSSERPLAEAAFKILGPAGAGLIVLGASFSMVGYNAGAALVSPRYLTALAQDAHLPSGLAASHPKFASPYRAVAVSTFITLAAALVFDFNKLVDFSNVVVTTQYLATCAAVPILRRRKATLEGAFRLPGGALIPCIGAAATLWLGLQGGMAEVGWTLGILAFGFLLRAATRYCRHRNLSSAENPLAMQQS